MSDPIEVAVVYLPAPFEFTATLSAPPVEVAQIGELGPKGNNGNAGASAYQTAVANGFSGTQSEWLQSLRASGGDRQIKTVDANATLLITDKFVRVIQSCTLTLPAATENFECTIKNASSGSVTINRSGSDLIDGADHIILTPGQARGLSGFQGGFDVW